MGGQVPGPFGEPLDALARATGGWPDGVMVYGVEVIGTGDDPQILLTGSEADWMPLAKRWSFNRKNESKAVVRLSEYRAALSATNQTGASSLRRGE